MKSEIYRRLLENYYKELSKKLGNFSLHVEQKKHIRTIFTNFFLILVFTLTTTNVFNIFWTNSAISRFSSRLSCPLIGGRGCTVKIQFSARVTLLEAELRDIQISTAVIRHNYFDSFSYECFIKLLFRCSPNLSAMK